MGGDQAANVLATIQRENFERENKVWSIEEENLFKVTIFAFFPHIDCCRNQYWKNMKKKAIAYTPVPDYGMMVLSSQKILAKSLEWHLVQV